MQENSNGGTMAGAMNPISNGADTNDELAQKSAVTFAHHTSLMTYKSSKQPTSYCHTEENMSYS